MQRIRRTDNEWFSIFQSQLDSGLSVLRFCIDNDIPTPSFYKAKRRLMNREESSFLLPVVIDQPVLNKFIVNGVPIEIPQDLDPEQLAVLIRACMLL